MHSRNIISSLFATSLLVFSGCGGGGDGASVSATSNDVRAVDGYIKDANLTDGVGQVGVYSSNGKYRFSNSITYPLHLRGGVYEDTNASFDINMTAHSGNVISPITSFLENNATLRDKLVALGISNASTLSGLSTDYISSNNANLARLSQLLYLVQKDANLTRKFKQTLANENPASLGELIVLIESDVSATMGIYAPSYRSFLSAVANLNGEVSGYELLLQTHKRNLGKIVQNMTEYSIVVSPKTQRVWLDRNLGASQVCENLNDSACFGDYYQWGRPHDGHENSLGGVNTLAEDITPNHSRFIENSNDFNDWTTADSNGSLRVAFWSKADGNSICPEGFRVPTYNELEAETNTTITDNVTAFDSFLKIPSAGDHLYTNGNIYNQGVRAYLWTVGVQGSYSKNFFAKSTDARYGGDRRALGIAVRCIKD